jgi:Ca2+-binding RTX toxin-like protein
VLTETYGEKQMVTAATINQFRAGNPLDIIENAAELPGQSLQSFTSTKIVWGKKSGNLWAQDRIEVEGQNLSYNPITGVASGTVTSIKIIPAALIIIGGVPQPNPLEIVGLSQDVSPIVQAVLNGDYSALTAILSAQPFVYNGSSGDDTVTFGATHDRIHMGAGDDVAHGGGGNDLLEGWSGDDILYGDAGHDLFYGNTGNDRLYGGDGDDTIYAAEDDDYLVGGVGKDTMYGGTGNDRYYVDNSADIVIEKSNEGTADRVLTSANYSLKSGVGVEILSTTNAAGTTALKLAGNSYANTVVGNAGANFINGGAGADTLTGLGGKDTFMFNTALGSPNVDTITDFNVADDTIRLENGIFTAISGTGALTAAQFVKNTTGLAQDSSDRIIYETDTGKLFYDANGSASGGRLLFATLDKNLALTAGDFFIV